MVEVASVLIVNILAYYKIHKTIENQNKQIIDISKKIDRFEYIQDEINYIKQEIKLLKAKVDSLYGKREV